MQSGIGQTLCSFEHYLVSYNVMLFRKKIVTSLIDCYIVQQPPDPGCGDGNLSPPPGSTPRALSLPRYCSLSDGDQFIPEPESLEYQPVSDTVVLTVMLKLYQNLTYVYLTYDFYYYTTR